MDRAFYVFAMLLLISSTSVNITRVQIIPNSTRNECAFNDPSMLVRWGLVTSIYKCIWKWWYNNVSGSGGMIMHLEVAVHMCIWKWRCIHVSGSGGVYVSGSGIV